MLSKAERNGGLYEQREMFGERVRKCCTASREPLHFIVMSVMVVISLYLWDYGMIVPWRCAWGPSCCHQFIVIE